MGRTDRPDPPRNGAGAYTRIQLAALTLFADKGFHATGIREIGTTAGVSSSVLYHYASSKDDILLTLVQDGLSRYADALVLAHDAADEPADRLGAMVAVHVLVPVLHPRMGRLLAQESAVLSPEGVDQVRAMRDDIEHLWTGVLTAGRDTGVFSIDSVQIARLALVHSATMVSRWFRPEGALAIDEIATQYVDLALGLVRAHRNGRELRATDLAGPDLPRIRAIIAESHDGVWW